LPEAVGAVDGGVGDGAGVLCRVDEELGFEGGFYGVEEGGLLVGGDGVDAAEG